MIELYGCGSPNVFKILFMFSETGLNYELHRVAIHSGGQYAPEFLALNPNNKVPVIVDSEGPGGKPHTVFESGAILIYLAEKTGLLLPQDPVGRSDTLQWLIWQMAGIGPMFGQALHFKFIAPESNEYARQRYFTEVYRLYEVLERRLAQSTYIAGDAFTIADVATYPWAGKYIKTLQVDIAKRPNLARWVAAIEGRPGYQRVHRIAADLFKQDLKTQKQADADGLDRFFGRGRYFRAG